MSAPPTTNKTAGFTPHPNNRKINFDRFVTKPTPISPRKKPKYIISNLTKSSMNTLFFNTLPDGWLNSFCTKGSPEGEVGYLHNAYYKMNESLQDESDQCNSFASNMMVSAVLPVRSPLTLQAKEYKYTDKKTGELHTSNVMSFVHNTMYLDNTSPDEWCRNQVKDLKNRFHSIRNLTFGGNASLSTGQHINRLDEIFEPEDVANLAFSLYETEIYDGSFFSNTDLVNCYFRHTPDVVAVFKSQGLIV